MKRIAALGIAAAALGAIALQFHLNGAKPGLEPPGARLWDLLRYFTILTNGLVGVVLLRVATGAAPGAAVQGTAALNIAMVGAVYQLLLRPDVPPEGLAWWADISFHAAVPVAMPLWWLIWGARPARLSGVLAWLVWPVGYCVYALVRGLAESRYPYFFLDLGTYGVAQVALNIAGLSAGFALAGLALLALARLWDGLIGRRLSR